MNLFLFLCNFALADAISMIEESECPPGSTVSASHAGTWCQATTCENVDDCAEDATCEEVSLCVVESQVACGGGWNQDTACFVDKIEALTLCGSDGSCEEGECQTAVRCVSAEQQSKLGCSGCASADMGKGALFGFGLVAIFIGWRRD